MKFAYLSKPLSSGVQRNTHKYADRIGGNYEIIPIHMPTDLKPRSNESDDTRIKGINGAGIWQDLDSILTAVVYKLYHPAVLT